MKEHKSNPKLLAVLIAFLIVGVVIAVIQTIADPPEMRWTRFWKSSVFGVGCVIAAMIIGKTIAVFQRK